MSSVKTTQLDGDVSVGRNTSIGGNITIQGGGRVKGTLVIDGWLDAKNIKGSNKGIFTTAEKLREAFPRPHDGWWAIVGKTLPSPIYVGDGGEWVATGESGGTPTLEDPNNTLQQVIDDTKNKVNEVKQAVENMVAALPIAQEAGDSTTKVMSQAAVTSALNTIFESKEKELFQASNIVNNRDVEGNSNNTQDYVDINVHGYDDITISGYTRNLGMVFLDKDKNKLRIESWNEDFSPKTCHIDKNDYYIRSLTRTSQGNFANTFSVVGHKKNVIEELEKEVGNLRKTDKNVTPLLNQNTSFGISIDAKRGDVFSIIAESDGDLDYDIYLLDKNYSVLSVVNSTKVNGSVKEKQKTITIDLDNAQYVFIYTRTLARFILEKKTSSREEIDKDNINRTFQRTLPMITPEDFDGATLAERVKALNKFILASNGGFEVVFAKEKEYLLTEAFRVPSNTNILVDGARIKMSDGIFDNVFRSANVIIDEQNPYDVAKKIDGRISNVNIIGRNGAAIAGPTAHYIGADRRGAMRKWIGDTFGWRGHLISLTSCDNLNFGGFYVSDNNSYSVVVSDCTFSKFHDIFFNTDELNGDGIDVVCSHDLEIYNIFGKTQDDTICLSGDSTSSRLGGQPYTDKYQYSLNPLGWDFGEGGTYNIYIHDVMTEIYAGHVLIFLTNKANIYNVTMKHVGSTKGTNPSILFYGKTGIYNPGYTDGAYHNIACYDVFSKQGKATEFRAVPHNSYFCKVSSVLYSGVSEQDLSNAHTEVMCSSE